MGLLYEYKDDMFYLHHTRSESPDPASKSFSMQLHDKYELYYCVSGSGEFIVEGNSYKLSAGMVMILRSGEAHSLHISPSEPYERIALLFSPKFVEKSSGLECLLDPFKNRRIGRDNCFMPERTDTSFVLSCLNNMLSAGASSDEKKIAVMSNLPAALSYLRRSFVGGGASETEDSDGIVGEIAAYINAHLFESWSLSDLQDALHRNKDYLGRRFKEAMGSGIWEYTNHKRIIAARQNIIEGYSIEDVFEKSGFGDYSTFYRQYKAVTGVSPSDDAKAAGS